MNPIWKNVESSKDHSGTTLAAHLEGTEALLKLWGQRRCVRLAGRYHAVYGNPGGRSAICSPRDTFIVQEIGDEAEQLVHLWAILERGSLTRAINDFVAGAELIRLVSHKGEPLSVARQQYADLAHIQVANSIEVASRTKSVNFNLQMLHPALSPDASAHLRRFYPGKWRIFMLKLRVRARVHSILERLFSI